jgi:hypothetical protein
MPSRLHQALVGFIVFQDAQRIKTTGWASELKRHELIDVYEIRFPPERRPDAFLIEPDRQPGRITVWEVEVDGPLSPQRLEEWAWAWGDCNASGFWELRLYVLNRLGEFHRVKLEHLYYGFVAIARPRAEVEV